MTASNAFADLTLVCGDIAIPLPLRDANQWSVADEGVGWVLWQASGPDNSSLRTARSSNWRLWCFADPCSGPNGEAALSRMVDDLARGRSGPDFPSPFTLVFALDESTGTWHVITDRLGTTHAYVGSGANGTVLSTFSPAAATCGGAAPDWIGIGGFCSFGFFPADRTWWTDVKIIRPATWLTLRNGTTVTTRRYWDWSYRPHDRPIAELTEEITDTLSEIITDLASEQPLVIPISGGLDSRLLAGVLAAQSTSHSDGVRGFTYGYSSSSREISVAAAVGRAAGLNVEELVVPTYLLDQLDTVIDVTEGFTSISQPRQAGAADLIHRLGHTVVGGHWGDVWFDTSGTPRQAPTGDLVGAAISKFSKPGSRWLVDHLCADHISPSDLDQALREEMSEEVNLLPELGDPDMTLKALKTQQWSFRWTLAGVRAYQLGAAVALPFYDNRFVDLMLTIPSELHRSRQLQQEVLRRHYPALASVPWQATGRSLFSEPPRATAELLQRAGRKAVRLLTRDHVVERNWEVQLRSPAARPRLDELLLNGPVTDLVSSVESEQLLDDFDARVDREAGYAVDMLVTIAAWLRRFGG